MKKLLNHKWGPAVLLLGLFFLFSLFINPEELFSNTVFYNFQGRDLSRARELLSGHWIFYGPEMTGGGNLPGPLYYYLLAAGLLVEKSWISAWMLQYFLIFIAALTGFLFLQRKSVMAAFLWVIFFATAPLTAWFIKLFLNVSYLLPFAVGALVSIHFAFAAEENKNAKKYFYIASCLIGVGLQFHFSLIFFWFAMIFMMIFAKKMKLNEFSSRTKILGTFLFLLPSLPYLIWLTCSHLGIHFGDPAFYSGEPEKALPSILFLIKSSFNSSLPKLLGSWTNKFFFTVPFALLPFFFTSRKKKSSSESVLIICLLFSFIPYFNWYLSPQANRYTILFYVCLNFFTAYKIKDLMNEDSNTSLLSKIAVLTLIITWIYSFITYPLFENRIALLINILLIGVSYLVIVFFIKKKNLAVLLSLLIGLSHMQKLVFPETVFYTRSIEGYMPSYRDWKHIFTVIHNETGWNFDVMKNRTYFIGHHVNQDPGLFSEALKFSTFVKHSDPDGFIISNRYKARHMRISPREWLLKQNLHKDILQALDNDELQLGQNLSDSILILPYYVKNERTLPRHFHNLGEGYQISNDDLLLEKINQSEGTARLDSSSWLFKWNECSDRNRFCSTGAIVTLESDKLKIKVIGSAISQISPWVSPNFTQQWVDPRIEIKCGSTITKFDIASSIGFSRSYSHSSKTFFFAGNNSFVAPFERTFPISCKQRPELITIGRKKSNVETIVNMRELPEKTLTVKL